MKSEPRASPGCFMNSASDPKVKRRVVKRAFYSSEEDESTEEEFEEKDNSVAAPEVSRLLVEVLLAWQASVRYYATSVSGDLRGWENHWLWAHDDSRRGSYVNVQNRYLWQYSRAHLSLVGGFGVHDERR